MSYSFRCSIHRNCFVFRHPTGLVRNVFLQPFTVPVWYCVIVAGVFVIATTSFISRREVTYAGKMRSSPLYSSRDHVGHSVPWFWPIAIYVFLIFVYFHVSHYMWYIVIMWQIHQVGHSEEFSGGNSLTKHNIVNVRPAPDRLDHLRMQSQQQPRRRHQANNSTNSVHLKQHRETLPKREINQRYRKQQAQPHRIPQENVIIAICTKVLRKCFFSTVVSVYTKCLTQQMHT